MAIYDPPQPLWKRNVAGILDFFLAAAIFSVPFWMAFGSVVERFNPMTGAKMPTYGLSGWPLFFLLLLIVAYFILLGQTGGTVFQRLFGMKRAK